MANRLHPFKLGYPRWTSSRRVFFSPRHLRAPCTLTGNMSTPHVSPLLFRDRLTLPFLYISPSSSFFYFFDCVQRMKKKKNKRSSPVYITRRIRKITRDRYAPNTQRHVTPSLDQNGATWLKISLKIRKNHEKIKMIIDDF